MPNKNLLENPITDIAIVKQLIPHREPLIMVDGLLYFDGSIAITGLTISDANIFVENKHFSEVGMIEHMAQSAALMTGYKYKSQSLPIREGFIAAIKNIKVESLPKVKEEVFTEVQITYEIATMTIVKLTSKVNNYVVAMAEMTLVLKEKE